MNVAERCEKFLLELQDHLRDELLPFWLTHGVDEGYGGFLTNFDRRGRPEDRTLKTLVCQTRMIYTYSSIHRANLAEGQALPIARQGVDFLLTHFWDDAHEGWYWTTEQDGRPVNRSKLTYGQSFGIYALSEYAMASGDPRALDHAVRTFQTLQTFAADNFNGGWLEFLEQNWQPKKPGVYGGDRKSFDVHMHLMEAFTNLYEATGAEVYRTRAMEAINLIFRHMIHPEQGTGIAQFSLDWRPLRAIIFKDVWGSDRDVGDDEGRPLNNTSFGHNVEFAWLLNHSISMLGLNREDYRESMGKLYDHALEFGVDWERGGVYCEGPHDGPARERNKEFWQQAECLVGFLDAYLLFEDAKYLDAYENVHRFVMDHVINHEVGEWYPLLDEDNNVIRDYMGHEWKINYHTVRAAREAEARLLKLAY